MKTLKGITLIELMVVISVVAFMIIILLPAFTTAAYKETSLRAVCANRLKNFCMANTIYSNEFDGAFCPIYYIEPNLTGKVVHSGVRYSSRNWLENQAFRRILDVDKYAKGKRPFGDLNTDRTIEASIGNMPAELLCPADKISIDARNTYAGVLQSYGYNITEWSMPGMWSQIFRDNPYMGQNTRNMPAPSTKFAFIDGINWWVNWKAANPSPNLRVGWNAWGQQNIDYYKVKGNIHGPVFYRHNEGANVGFYDGHVSYMRKNILYKQTDREPYDSVPDPLTNANPRRAGGWVVNMDIYIMNGQD